MTLSALIPDRVRALSLEAGFSDAAVVALPHAEEERDARRFETWVRAGRAGSMRYLERTAESGELVRSRVRVPFPWAQSAILCFARYDSAEPRSLAPARADAGWIARYAWSGRGGRPSDYHKVLLRRLKALEARLRTEFGQFESRAYVDTGPLVERSLAASADLGWTAKNTCLIHPRLGSFGFLAALVTALPVQIEPAIEGGKQEGDGYAPTPVADRCGSCRRCIDACPTHALISPYQMDATLCISYLTIEHKGPIPVELMEGMGRQIFGCDICQDVCPWNRKSLVSFPVQIDPDLAPRPELVNPSLDWLAEITEAQFEDCFNGSPIRRAGFHGLRRNIAIAMGNSGLGQFAGRLRQWTAEADEGLRSAAFWALGRLR